MCDSAYIGNLRSVGRAQVGVNLLLAKENHSVFLSDDGGPTKTKFGTMISQLLHTRCLIQRTGGSGRPPDAKSVVVVLKGRRAVKKTYVRNKLSKNAAHLSCDLAPITDGGLVQCKGKKVPLLLLNNYYG